MATLLPDIGLDMQVVLTRMLDELRSFLPAPVGDLPLPGVIIISLNDAPVGLGNFIGEEGTGLLGRRVVKGGRLDAVVRFVLWGSSLPQVNAAILTLQAKLLSALQSLWANGFLRFNSLTSSNPSFDTSLSSWTRTADYGVLYEYHYYPADDAQSLISRIPIHADQERLSSPDRESAVVSDEMVRWDDQSAPTLAARGPLSSTRLAALAFATAMPTGAVTLTRTFDGAAGAPVDHPTLAAFLSALADPLAPQRHARVTFPTLTDFLSLFTPVGDPLQLGDWDLDSTPDDYQNFELALDPPVTLPGVFDRLEVTYRDGTEPLDQVAVFYLRLKP